MICPLFDSNDQIFSKPWWTVHDVAKYMSLLKGKPVGLAGARTFMVRNEVQRSPADRTLTTRTWVDSALKKGKRKTFTAEAQSKF